LIPEYRKGLSQKTQGGEEGASIVGGKREVTAATAQIFSTVFVCKKKT